LGLKLVHGGLHDEGLVSRVTIKDRNVVQNSVRHVESDGLVVSEMDGLSLGQVLLDGPRKGWIQQDPG